MSKRQQIIDAVETRAKTILTAGGYTSNIGAHVFVWKTDDWSADQLPGIAISDRTSENVPGSIGQFRRKLVVDIEIRLADGSADDKARTALADFLKAVGVDPTWGGLAQTTEQPESDEIDINNTGQKFGAVDTSIGIIYDTPKWEL